MTFFLWHPATFSIPALLYEIQRSLIWNHHKPPVCNIDCNNTRHLPVWQLIINVHGKQNKVTFIIQGIHNTRYDLTLTFGRSRMWLASSSSSSSDREYRRISSGTFGSEQCRLSTYSICRLQPLKIGMHLNIVVHVAIHFPPPLPTTTGFFLCFGFPYDQTRSN